MVRRTWLGVRGYPRAWILFACLAGCAQGASVTPGDAGKGVDAAPDGGPALPCGAAAQGCCHGNTCHSGFVCNEGLCGLPQGNDGGDASCTFMMCGTLCTDTMSDPTSCGQCGHSCQGNFCSVGLCLATGIATGTNPVQLAVDDANVYFTDEGNGTVDVAPKGGGSVVKLASGVPSPYGIALGGSFVYFTNQGTLAKGYTDGSVLKVFIGVSDAGAGTPLATGRQQPQSIVTDGTSVYWIEPGATDDGAILSCPLTGCPSNKPNVITNVLALPYGLALDSDNVYVTTSGGSQVLSVSKATGKTKVLVDMQNEPAGITAQNGKVYWVTTGDGLVNALPADGGEVFYVAATMGNPIGIAADSVNVYWSDSNPNPVTTFGPVDSCPVGGCPPANPVTLVGLTQTATYIAIDSTYVYWIGMGGQILRVAK